jgi:excisionase family DNA binding protein
MEKRQEVNEFPLLLKVEAAARLLSLGRTKMYELIAAGDVPVIRLGRSVRVPTASLRQWVEDRSKQSPSV